MYVRQLFSNFPPQQITQLDADFQKFNQATKQVKESCDTLKAGFESVMTRNTGKMSIIVDVLNSSTCHKCFSA